MPKITFRPSDVTVDAEPGSCLYAAAKAAGVPADIPCGGKGVCLKCMVQVLAGAVADDEPSSLPRELRDEGWVLLCRARVGDRPAEVLTGADLSAESGRFVEEDDLLCVAPELRPEPADFSPLCRPVSVTVAPPAAGDGLSDLDRLCRALPTPAGIPLSVLRTLPDALRVKDGAVEVYQYEADGGLVVAGVLPTGNLPMGTEAGFGLAIDIGTTTVAVELLSPVGERLAFKTAYNAQIECGLDVISRINYAKTPARLEELRDKVLGTVNALIMTLCRSRGIDPDCIFNLSVSANTTMVHLLMALPAEQIRLAPYTPAVYSVPLYTAGEIGLMAAPGAPVWMAPAVGSYVGGDITAGAICTSLASDSDEVVLFMDIGTNGEILLGNQEFLLGCACSAGPAFEGGGIQYGMRASAGAIERVDIDHDGLKLSVIGDGKAAGICGTGLISLTAGLLKAELIDAAGRFDQNAARVIPGRPASYLVADSDQTENGRPLTVSETDLDNLIRAKAAVFSACMTLLQSVGLTFADLSRVYVAGGFGRHLNLADATAIGLLPALPANRFVFLGNSALTGARMALNSSRHRALVRKLAARVTYVDLSNEPGYMDDYMAALFLPHTDLTLFKS